MEDCALVLRLHLAREVQDLKSNIGTCGALMLPRVCRRSQQCRQSCRLRGMTSPLPHHGLNSTATVR